MALTGACPGCGVNEYCDPVLRECFSCRNICRWTKTHLPSDDCLRLCPDVFKREQESWLAGYTFYQESAYVLLAVCAVFVILALGLGLVVFRRRPRRRGLCRNNVPALGEGDAEAGGPGEGTEMTELAISDGIQTPTQDRNNEEYTGYTLLEKTPH